MHANASFNSKGVLPFHGDFTRQRQAPGAPSDVARVERADPDKAFKEGLTTVAPALRAFAITMARHVDRADDLVQETLLKAWANRHRYEEGTNLRGWLFVILRNTFYSQYRKSNREVEDVGDRLAQTLLTPASQDDHMDVEDFKLALAKIPDEQREALILTGGSGFTYEEAAEICGCAIGTVKSRVSRARSALAEILGLDVSPLMPTRRSTHLAQRRPSTPSYA